MADASAPQLHPHDGVNDVHPSSQSHYLDEHGEEIQMVGQDDDNGTQLSSPQVDSMKSRRLDNGHSPNPRRIFVGNIPRNCTIPELARLIGDAVGHDPPSDVKIIMDKETGQSKGYGFITFESQEIAQKCLELNDSVIIKGKVLNFGPAKRKPKTIKRQSQDLSNVLPVYYAQPSFIPGVNGQPYVRGSVQPMPGYSPGLISPQSQPVIWQTMWMDPTHMQPNWDNSQMMQPVPPDQYYDAYPSGGNIIMGSELPNQKLMAVPGSRLMPIPVQSGYSYSNEMDPGMMPMLIVPPGQLGGSDTSHNAAITENTVNTSPNVVLENQEDSSKVAYIDHA